ncbi:MAG: cation:proton antiporter, partial [Nanoarchaeota archaeon]|nr:cation:proton antiporter [Nanoarchaeota archaeon]
SLGASSPGKSFIHRLDPRAKIIFMVIVSTSIFMIENLAVAAVVLVLMLLGVAISPSFMAELWKVMFSFELVSSGVAPKLFLHEEVITLFAQLGAIILLFKVGVHSKIEKVFSKENMFVAIAGVLFPFIAGYLYAANTGGNFAYSMFLGATLAATSVGVTVAVLKDLGVLGKRFSEVIIGAAILDDILGLLVLSVVVNLAEGATTALNSILTTFAASLIFLIGAILTGKYIVEYMDKRELSQKRFLVALAYMLGLAYIAEAVKLSAIVGAFLAGIILSRSRHYNLIEEKTSGLEYLFMPIFFISLGMLVDVNAIARFIWPIVIITLIACITKLVGCGLAARAAKLSFLDSAIVGIGMMPRGEVALIIASIGLTKNILSQNEYSIISAMAILTSIIVPFLLSWVVSLREDRVPDYGQQ